MSRKDFGELDFANIRPLGYLPFDCDRCRGRRVELLLAPLRTHCEKCRAVHVIEVRDCNWPSDFEESSGCGAALDELGRCLKEAGLGIGLCRCGSYEVGSGQDIETCSVCCPC